MDSQETSRFDGPRAARPDELDGVLDLANLVMRQARGYPPTIATDYPFIYNQENLENIIVVKDGSQIISMVAIWVNEIQLASARLKIGGINCLATRPGFRGLALASAVMQAAHVHMQKLGCQVARLTTGITRWYRRLGWDTAGILCSYELNHSNIILLPNLPDGVDVRCFDGPFDGTIVEQVCGLRDQDKLGGIRTPELMKVLLGSGSDPKVQSVWQLMMAFEGARPTAYLLDREGSIAEWAGPANILSGLVRNCFECRAKDQVSGSKMDRQTKVAASEKMLLVGPQDGHPFLEILQGLGMPCHRDYWGMLYILDPRGVLDAFGHHDIDVVEDNGRIIVSRDGQSLSLTRQQLVKLLFGPERIDGFASDVLPLKFWQWSLDHV